jgi:aminoglycoside phosphotransferase (APT) family kinase protein
VFRFPRREVALPGFRREMAMLPHLGSRLPLAVPNPVFLGAPCREFPWPFFGAAYLPGREAVPAGPDETARIGHAPALGEFLRALHVIDLDLGELLPVDPTRRADMGFRAPWAGERLRQLARRGLWRAPTAMWRLLDEAPALPPPADGTAIVHGDLHVRHLLVGELGPTGVIDWGDICRGDPAIDLMLYWSYVPPAGRPAFRDAYGPVTGAQLARARVLAVFLSATLALYGHTEDLPELAQEALAGLERTAAG